MKDFRKEEIYISAKKRVKDIKGFYSHILVYIIVNTLLSTLKVMHSINNGESFSEAFFDIKTFMIWMAWAIGIIFHGFAVFSDSTISFKRWKDKKLIEFIEEEESHFGVFNKSKNTFYKSEIHYNASKRLENVMGFYWHMLAYLVINIFIFLILFFVTKISFTDWTTYAAAFFWGIGLSIHALCVFTKNLIFSKSWEERKMRQWMQEEK